MKTIITIKGTHCESCKSLIEDVARDVPGIISCDVDFQTGKAKIEHTDKLDWSIFQKEIATVGAYSFESPKKNL